MTTEVLRERAELTRQIRENLEAIERSDLDDLEATTSQIVSNLRAIEESEIEVQ